MTNNGNGVPAPPSGPYSEIRIYELSLMYDQEVIYNIHLIYALRKRGCPLDFTHIDNAMCNLVEKYLRIVCRERALYAADFDLESCPRCYCRDATIVAEPRRDTRCKHHQESELRLTKAQARFVSNSIKWYIFLYLYEHKQERPPYIAYIESLEILKLKQDDADNVSQFYYELLEEIEHLFPDSSVRAKLDRALLSISPALNHRLARFTRLEYCATFRHEECELCERRKSSLQYQPDTEPEEIFRHFLGAFRLHFYESLVDFLRALPNG